MSNIEFKDKTGLGLNIFIHLNIVQYLQLQHLYVYEDLHLYVYEDLNGIYK